MLFREILNKEAVHFCTGCSACVQRCTKNALSLVKDVQGYYVAHFESSACVNCDRCENICPILYPRSFAKRKSSPELYAVQMDDETRRLSSSGGVFSALAENILCQGGVVFGAAWQDDMTVSHIYIEDIKDLDRLRRSKYVQSYMGSSYLEVQRFLKVGKKVLFTGTPCQIAGLNAFLGKDNDNLLTVDVLCLYTPSQGYFKKYLEESFPHDNVVACNMRDKRYGWRCSVLSLSLSLSNGLNIIRRDYEDLWEQAFLNRLMKSEHCANCKFACHQRQADLTIGDFWEICDIDKHFDEQGTNSVLINSEKGWKYFNEISKYSKMCKKKPLRKLRGNRIEVHDYAKPHVQAGRFRELFATNGFLHSVQKCLTPHYDVCLMGCWEVRNYGSHLTYYALYHSLKTLGYDVVMVGCPADAPYKSQGKPEYFKVIPYREWEMQPQFQTKSDMRNANVLADTFIVGSDQLWEADLYEHFGHFSLLDFINEDKKKIAYATSFGRPFWKGDYKRQLEFSTYLKRFDHISVRETTGIDICRNTFGVDAVWNMDPIFLCERAFYDELAEKSDIDTSDDYIAAYILDCNQAKARILETLARSLGCKLRLLTDPNIKSELGSRCKREVGFKVEDWIRWIRDSKYVVTDSFHGMCVSLKFEKEFIAIVNERRGSARFYDYGNILNIGDRILSSFSELNGNLFNKQIDYASVNAIIAEEVLKSLDWLLRAIQMEKPTNGLSEFDINSMRIEAEREMLLGIISDRSLTKKAFRRIKNSYLYRGLAKIKRMVMD